MVQTLVLLAIIVFLLQVRCVALRQRSDWTMGLVHVESRSWNKSNYQYRLWMTTTFLLGLAAAIVFRISG
jgi:hypothetical protein